MENIINPANSTLLLYKYSWIIIIFMQGRIYSKNMKSINPWEEI